MRQIAVGIMDFRETDVEFVGSIGISNAESRRASTAKEESSQNKTKSRCALKKSFMWKTFKIVVFLMCLVFLMIQSLEFFHIYFKYPTNIVLETYVAKEFKLPAMTFCFRNTIPYYEFCSHEPDWCEKPSNVGEFCRKHPIHCMGDISNLTVPVQNETTRTIAMPYLFNDSFNYGRLVSEFNFISTTRTFLRDPEYPDMFLKCYSDNLHLYQSKSQPQTMNVDFRDGFDNSFAMYTSTPLYVELFYPIDEPKVFFGLHSPFVPIDLLELQAIKLGKSYNMDVQLEKEEHLLPPPYQTNCRDNGPSEDAKEFTNPNSLQMCLEMCRSEYSKEISGCDRGQTMVSSPTDLCYGHVERHNVSNERKLELEKKPFICTQNCKQGCLKLHYKYRIKEFTRPKISTDEFPSSDIFFNVKNLEVTVLRHVPLYGTSEIFSHVGGLLGCWLGISVFTFTDILEKFFPRVVSWKKRIRKEKGREDF